MRGLKAAVLVATGLVSLFMAASLGCARTPTFSTWIDSGQSVELRAFGEPKGVVASSRGPGAITATAIVRDGQTAFLPGIGPGECQTHVVGANDTLWLLHSTGCKVWIDTNNLDGFQINIHQAGDANVPGAR